MSRNLGAVALELAFSGFRVLPLRPNGKQPISAHGVWEASSQAIDIERWWGEHPDANIGLAVPSNWTVIDVDVRSGGLETLKRWQEEHGALDTLTQRTASGGYHFIYESMRPLRAKAGKGVDVVRVGRYIVVSPSVIYGKRYEWIRRGRPEKLPAWLAQLAEPEAVVPPPVALAPTDDTPALVVDRAAKYLAKIPGAVSGQGGHLHTFTVAQKLVRGFGLSDAQAWPLLCEWNRTCLPPWSERELRHKLKQARERGTMQPGKLARSKKQ